MFGLGRKDSEGRQVRIGHEGEHVRASRTSGVSVRAQGKVGQTNVTANSQHGVRVSQRVAKGLNVGVQNTNVRVRGRWSLGKMAFNLSKSAMSVSAKTGFGRLNLSAPGRSSFKIGGIQMRGHKAAYFNLIALAFQVCLFLVSLLIQIVALVLAGVAFGIGYVLGGTRSVEER